MDQPFRKYFPLRNAREPRLGMAVAKGRLPIFRTPSKSIVSPRCAILDTGGRMSGKNTKPNHITQKQVE
jgi:hypothetical protein